MVVHWNILATARKGGERFLLRLLIKYGEFRGAGFRDVVLGRVEDVDSFLKKLTSLQQENPGELNTLSQVIPLEKIFPFEVSDFMDRLEGMIVPSIEKLEDKKFRV